MGSDLLSLKVESMTIYDTFLVLREGFVADGVAVRESEICADDWRLRVSADSAERLLPVDRGLRIVAAEADALLRSAEHRRTRRSMSGVAASAAVRKERGIEMRVLRLREDREQSEHQGDQRNSWHERQTSVTVGFTQKCGVRPGR